jgi:hypothetical protein
VLGDTPPDARAATLISLAKACGVLDGLFTREERDATRERVAAIIRGRRSAKR